MQTYFLSEKAHLFVSKKYFYKHYRKYIYRNSEWVDTAKKFEHTEILLNIFLKIWLNLGLICWIYGGSGLNSSVGFSGNDSTPNVKQCVEKSKSLKESFSKLSKLKSK